jgi:hypothetical protein
MARERLRSTDAFGRAAGFGIAIHSMVDFGLHTPINALLCLTLVSIATPSSQAEKGCVAEPKIS